MTFEILKFNEILTILKQFRKPIPFPSIPLREHRHDLITGLELPPINTPPVLVTVIGHHPENPYNLNSWNEQLLTGQNPKKKKRKTASSKRILQKKSNIR